MKKITNGESSKKISGVLADLFIRNKKPFLDTE